MEYPFKRSAPTPNKKPQPARVEAFDVDKHEALGVNVTDAT
jgi:hypothetical protein